MIGSLRKLKDSLGNYIFPVTSSKAVYMSDGTTTLEAQLEENTTYKTAGGTATAITIQGVTLTNGSSKTFIASATSASTSKTINGKPFYKPGTVLSPSLTINKAYTVWYNLASNCFFLKASAEGTATPAQVLAGVPFSSEEDTGLVGIMIDRGTVNITPTNSPIAILGGKHSGSGVVAAVVAPADKIVVGTTIAGSVGTYNKVFGQGDTISYTRLGLPNPPITKILNMGSPNTIMLLAGISGLGKIIERGTTGLVTAFSKLFSVIYSVSTVLGDYNLGSFVSGAYSYFCTSPNGQGNAGVYKLNSETGALVWKNELYQSGSSNKYTRMSSPNINDKIVAIHEFYDGNSVTYTVRIFTSAGVLTTIPLGTSGVYETVACIDDEDCTWVLIKYGQLIRYNAARSQLFITAQMPIHGSSPIVYVNGYAFLVKSNGTSLYRISKTGVVTILDLSFGIINQMRTVGNTICFVGSTYPNNIIYIDINGAVVNNFSIMGVISASMEYPNNDIFVDSVESSSHIFKNIEMALTIT